MSNERRRKGSIAADAIVLGFVPFGTTAVAVYMNAESKPPNRSTSGAATLKVKESRLTGYLQGLDLQKDLMDLLERGHQEIELDLSTVEMISSSVIGTLIGVNREFWSRNAKLVLSNIAPSVKEILSSTRVDELFRIRDA